MHGLPNIAGGVRGIKRRAVKWKAQQVVERNVKRRLEDIFGK